MALMWKTPRGSKKKRLRLVPCENERAGMGSMGDVAALVIGAPRGNGRGELYRQGMAGMGGAATDVLNKLTGGAVGNVQAQLSRVETALKVSTAAAVIAAAVSLFSMRRR